MSDNQPKNRPGCKHFSCNKYRYPQNKFQVDFKLNKCSEVGKTLRNQATFPTRSSCIKSMQWVFTFVIHIQTFNDLDKLCTYLFLKNLINFASAAYGLCHSIYGQDSNTVLSYFMIPSRLVWAEIGYMLLGQNSPRASLNQFSKAENRQ